jgi:hypothetical protein
VQVVETTRISCAVRHRSSRAHLVEVDEFRPLCSLGGGGGSGRVSNLLVAAVERGVALHHARREALEDGGSRWGGYSYWFRDHVSTKPVIARRARTSKSARSSKHASTARADDNDDADDAPEADALAVADACRSSAPSSAASAEGDAQPSLCVRVAVTMIVRR